MKRSLLALSVLFLLGMSRLTAQTCLTNNIAAGQPVVSSYSSGASNVVDGNTSTIWQPATDGDQWLYIDLGQNYTLCKVVLLWNAWHSQDTFHVQFSTDTTHWTNIAYNTAEPVSGPTGSTYQLHTIDVSSSGMSGRYVRFYWPNVDGWFPQLEDIQVYNRVPLVLPVVSLTGPADGSNYIEGDSVTLQATASETSGTISQVQFYQGTTLIGTSTSSPYKYVWHQVPEGEYVVTAKAIDANGYSTASSSINVYVDYPDPGWSLTGNKGTNGDTSFLGTIDSMKLVLRTKNLKRMTILPNGNVGIGVDTPTAQLHTTGTVRFANFKNDSAGSSVLTTDTSGNLKLTKLSNMGGLTFANGLQQIGDTVGLYGGAMNLSQFPSKSLSLYMTNGQDSASTFLFSADGSTFHEVINNTQSSAGRLLETVGSSSSFNEQVSSSGSSTTAGVTIQADAVSTPEASSLDLSVSDSLGASSMYMYSTGIDFGTPNIEFYNFPNNNTMDSVLVTDSAGRLRQKSLSSFGSIGHWKTSGTTTYDSSDNIGIGVANTQGYKLAVNGSGIFTKVVVKPQASWPDYVFKKNYKLTGLDELEKYIHRYNHLPGIISATNVAKGDGVDIGQNQSDMLKKIEELTLYIIQQNKQLKERNQQAEEQRQQLQGQQVKLQNQQTKLESQQTALENMQQQIDELKKLIQAKNK